LGCLRVLCRLEPAACGVVRAVFFGLCPAAGLYLPFDKLKKAVLVSFFLIFLLNAGFQADSVYRLSRQSFAGEAFFCVLTGQA